MNVFTVPKFNAVVVAFNRGHACKLLGKCLEDRDETLNRKDVVEKLDIDTAQVLIMEESNGGV